MQYNELRTMKQRLNIPLPVFPSAFEIIHKFTNTSLVLNDIMVKPSIISSSTHGSFFFFFFVTAVFLMQKQNSSHPKSVHFFFLWYQPWWTWFSLFPLLLVGVVRVSRPFFYYFLKAASFQTINNFLFNTRFFHFFSLVLALVNVVFFAPTPLGRSRQTEAAFFFVFFLIGAIHIYHCHNFLNIKQKYNSTYYT